MGCSGGVSGLCRSLCPPRGLVSLVVDCQTDYGNVVADTTVDSTSVPTSPWGSQQQTLSPGQKAWQRVK